MAIDLLPKRDIVEVVYPNNDFGVAVTPGSSWAWSAWAQLTASLADHFILCGLCLYELTSATATPVVNALQVEAGTGGAGSEQTIARVATGMGYSASSNVETKNILKSEVLWVPPTRIAAGTRVAVRATKSSTDTLVINVALYGYNASDWPPILRHPDAERYMRGMEQAGGAKTFPTAGVAQVTTGGSLWSYGAWAQIVAAGAQTKPLLVTGAAVGGTAVSGAFHAEIGTGGAGSEASHGLVVAPGRSSAPGPGFGAMWLPRPVFVKPGERVAMRARGRPANTAYDVILTAFEIN